MMDVFAVTSSDREKIQQEFLSQAVIEIEGKIPEADRDYFWSKVFERTGATDKITALWRSLFMSPMRLDRCVQDKGNNHVR